MSLLDRTKPYKKRKSYFILTKNILDTKNGTQKKRPQKSNFLKFDPLQWDVFTHFSVRSKSTKQQVDPLDYLICCSQTFFFFCLGWFGQKQISAYISQLCHKIYCLMAYIVRRANLLII